MVTLFSTQSPKSGQLCTFCIVLNYVLILVYVATIFYSLVRFRQISDVRSGGGREVGPHQFYKEMLRLHDSCIFSGWHDGAVVNYMIVVSLVGGMMVQQLALSPHSKMVPYEGRVFLCVVCMFFPFLPFRCSGCLPKSKDMQVRLIGHSKLPVGVNLVIDEWMYF